MKKSLFEKNWPHTKMTEREVIVGNHSLFFTEEIAEPLSLGELCIQKVIDSKKDTSILPHDLVERIEVYKLNS